MIYLDNAATSYPKPPQVVEAVTRYLNEAGSPARSSHGMSLAASRSIYAAREGIAELVGADDPIKVAFTVNATAGINYALKGILRTGDHVVTTGVEHNSVMRPLRTLENNGVELSVVSCNSQGYVDIELLKDSLRPNTSMVVMTHASNVLGSIQPIREVGRVCREWGILLLVDAAQTLGAVPIDMEGDCIDLLAFSGHKSLYGPQGTGGLVIGGRVDVSELRPLIHGGTGSRSEIEEQPDFLPDLLESGTPNGPGIAGLAAGVEFIQSLGVESIREREMMLIERLLMGLIGISGVVIHGPQDCRDRIPVISLNIEGRDPARIAFDLEERYGIMCRAGLHCAPSAHRTAGTLSNGSIRLSPGYFQILEEIDSAIAAVRELAAGG